MYHLKDYDWLFYLDTDLLILNHDIKVEDYIDDNYNLIIGPQPHEGHLMTSGMLIKNCRWSFEFFLDLYAQVQFINNPYHSPPGTRLATGSPDTGGNFLEQSAFHFLYDTEEKYAKQIKIVPRKWFNSEIGTYQEGDFLLHFPGQLNKLQLMNLMLTAGYDEVVRKGRTFNSSNPWEAYKEYHNNYEKIQQRKAAMRIKRGGSE